MDYLNDIAHEVHEDFTVDGAFSPRDVAEAFVQRVADLEGSGRAEPTDFLRRLTITGASKWLADFRRKSLIAAKTVKGAFVNIPRYAGVKVDGKHQQMAFFTMDAGTLAEHVEKLKTGRDTLSREISLKSSLLKAMAEDPALATAGEAFAKLELAA